MPGVEENGIVGGVNVGLPILMTMGAFLTISLYNVIELTFVIFATFRQRKGLYFWSLLVATWGIAPHALGFIFKFFQIIRSDLVSCAIVAVGWTCMVMGQSVVLYSRLHLIIQDPRKTRWILNMIIFDAIAFGCPLVVLAFGANSKYSARFLETFVRFDKIQLVIFSIQEAIISGIYIYETIRLLGHGGKRQDVPIRKLLQHLILVNVVVLIFDISLIATQFSGHYEIQTTYKAAVYSVKLKIEFSVLNRLVQVVKKGRSFDGELPLDTFIRSRNTRPSIVPGGQGSFVKMDDIGPIEFEKAESSTSRPEIVPEEPDSIALKTH
ncbi:hypothetical protein K505DRAFT_23905 [Melanomma pulvis-pyrius CBS 109.77]|uniref:DUF7703 domain-containing protein n=1 Tax=Melanomma pulvis-pyrius CBS 109.77 TaxID=1314802 RepID=A0A6A6XDH5_9PLEO|nr:hypothetical protein K505DRAFT_23905 [Melanomma pulvis-pyrius CBS 109.77]